MPRCVRVGVHLGVDAHPLVGGSPALEWTVREMKPEDLDGVMAIETASFPTPWTRKMFLEEIGRHFSDTLVVVPEDKGGLAGYAVCWTIGEDSHLLNIAVRPELRGKGAGRVLLRECIRRAARAGSRRVQLEVRAANEVAIGLYLAEGFFPAGVRKGYYTDTGEDALLLDREIVKGDDA